MQPSFPVEQPQPNQEFYGLDVLPLLQAYTRDSYRAAGNGDPIWDPSRPEQDWWDDTYASHPPDEQVAFCAVVWADDGTATIGTFTQKAAWMRAPNFKGLPSYPKWSPAPTIATRGGVAQDPYSMSLQSEAEALKAEIGGLSITDVGLATLVIQGIAVLQATQYAPDDPRRMWSVVLSNGGHINVGYALREKYSAGIGHPGHWTADSLKDGGLGWIPYPVPDGSDSNAKPLPPPCRPLKPNEELLPFMTGTWTKGTRVHRKDLAVPPPTPSGGTSTDTGDIADIQTKVTALYNLLVPHN